MIFKTRPGVVLTEICGEFLLVSAASARDQCPYVNQVNESFAFLWKRLENGCSEKELVDALLQEYEFPNADLAVQEVKAFLTQQVDKGYVIPIERGTL